MPNILQNYKSFIRTQYRPRKGIDIANPIFASNVKVMKRDGRIESYTHIVDIKMTRNKTVVTGERSDENGLAINAADEYSTDSISFMTIEFQLPRL